MIHFRVVFLFLLPFFFYRNIFSIRFISLSVDLLKTFFFIRTITPIAPTANILIVIKPAGLVKNSKISGSCLPGSCIDCFETVKSVDPILFSIEKFCNYNVNNLDILYLYGIQHFINSIKNELIHENQSTLNNKKSFLINYFLV